MGLCKPGKASQHFSISDEATASKIASVGEDTLPYKSLASCTATTDLRTSHKYSSHEIYQFFSTPNEFARGYRAKCPET